MSENLKKLTGKNPKDFEPVAYALINNADENLFSELVAQDDFLFDFVKCNVANRLKSVCNENNYKNLLSFLKYYSPSYEEFITEVLARYSDEDLTDEMLAIFENGTVAEKTYCAKYFSIVQDSLALDLLKKFSRSDDIYLLSNCASTLALLGDKSLYFESLENLQSDDDFVQLDAVRFLVAYGDDNAVPELIKLVKKSTMAENVAGEILYLTDLFKLYSYNKSECLYLLTLIISGLGEILSLAQVTDFQLYDFFAKLMSEHITSEVATVLLLAQDKFETLTENDEYLFDESKDTKQEVLDIKQLLKKIDNVQLYSLIDNEINEDSLFVFTALDYTENESLIRGLLTSRNQTLVLKSLETLKMMDSLQNIDKEIALKSVTDENIRAIILAI